MKTLYTFALLISTFPLFGQATTGYHRVNQVIARSNSGTTALVVPFAQISVTDTATHVAATIYNDPLLSSPIASSLVTADLSGNYSYYMPLNTCNTEVISAPGQSNIVITNICGNPASSVTLQTNGNNNGVQTLLNLVAGNGVVLENVGGDVTINAEGGTGVTSINTVPGAFTFSGSGVTCASTTCTFTGGGTPFGGSPGIAYALTGSTSRAATSSDLATLGAIVSGDMCGGALSGTFPNCTIVGLSAACLVPLSDGAGNLAASNLCYSSNNLFSLSAVFNITNTIIHGSIFDGGSISNSNIGSVGNAAQAVFSQIILDGNGGTAGPTLNVPSALIQFQSYIWNGTAVVPVDWQIQSVPTPSSGVGTFDTLAFTHAGSSSTYGISMPSLLLTNLISAPFISTDSNGKLTAGAGFSGTKTAGSCVITIVSGIITNVTGC